ncbi:zf-C3HC4_3 domain-containing protein [Cephalotus follicularis]|uniref:Zf-C3HC4_3 domain-containing protein n=1 Tax=Cephalotus follicularis TaxID=3775 RepID=A0A1Q3ASP6_CEPFO|nr:zf-C3HC4_3 domain-containing protein [Cephalotus follicularis]
MPPTLHVLHQLKVHVNNQSLNLTKINEDDLVEWCVLFPFAARVVAYIAILVLIVITIFVILKYIGDFGDGRTVDEVIRATETHPFCPRKAMSFTYGTCEKDLESGNCTSSSGGGSSSEELYDGKICVICYDEERNCFFVPCGHCATCYDCAQRIFKGETKTCPVCRRFISKVRKLFAP